MIASCTDAWGTSLKDRVVKAMPMAFEQLGKYQQAAPHFREDVLVASALAFDWTAKTSVTDEGACINPNTHIHDDHKFEYE